MEYTKLIIAQATTNTPRKEGIVIEPEEAKSTEHSGPHIPSLMGSSIGHNESINIS